MEGNRCPNLPGTKFYLPLNALINMNSGPARSFKQTHAAMTKWPFWGAMEKLKHFLPSVNPKLLIKLNWSLKTIFTRMFMSSHCLLHVWHRVWFDLIINSFIPFSTSSFIRFFLTSSDKTKTNSELIFLKNKKKIKVFFDLPVLESYQHFDANCNSLFSKDWSGGRT